MVTVKVYMVLLTAQMMVGQTRRMCGNILGINSMNFYNFCSCCSQAPFSHERAGDMGKESWGIQDTHQNQNKVTFYSFTVMIITKLACTEEVFLSLLTYLFLKSNVS